MVIVPLSVFICAFGMTSIGLLWDKITLISGQSYVNPNI
jgi:hypothetical protein